MTNFSVEKLLCPDQYGFRPGNQTTHVVRKLINFIAEKAYNNEVVLTTFIDMSKAFNCIQYDKLYKKTRIPRHHRN